MAIDKDWSAETGLNEMDKNRFNLESAVTAMKESLPHYLELAAIEAKVRHERFQTMVKEGFSAEQALEIIKSTHWAGGNG